MITIAFYYLYFRIESSNNIITDKTRRPGETLRLLTETEKPQAITLFLLLADTRELGNKAVPGLSPCWDHLIHVVQSRDIALDPKDVKKFNYFKSVKNQESKNNNFLVEKTY